jgi:hypothetical protein
MIFIWGAKIQCCLQLPTVIRSYPHLLAVTHSYSQLPTSTRSFPQLPAVTHSYLQLPAVTHKYPQFPTVTQKYPRLPTSTRSYPQVPAVSHKYRQLPTSTHSYPQLPRRYAMPLTRCGFFIDRLLVSYQIAFLGLCSGANVMFPIYLKNYFCTAFTVSNQLTN